MSLSVVQHVFHGSGTSGDNIATISSSSAGNPLIVGVGAGHDSSATSVASVTDNQSNTYVQVANSPASDANIGGAVSISEIWWCDNPAGGVTTITVVLNDVTNIHDHDVEVWEVSGFTSPSVDAANNVDNSSAGSNPSGAAVTAAGADEFVAAILVYGDNFSATQPFSGNAFTSDDFVNTGSLANFGAMHLITSGSGSVTPQWATATSSKSCGSTAAFKSAGGGGPVIPVFMNQYRQRWN